MKIEQIRQIERLQLTSQEISVMKLLAQLEAGHVATLEGITKQRVSQVKKSAMNKLEMQGFLNQRGRVKDLTTIDFEEQS